jgi:hypothetical protein
MTTNNTNTNATYTFVHPVISKDSYAVSKLLPMVTFSEWDNKEAILATFTFLQEYNITTIKADVPIFKCDEEERQYRKDIFGLRYCNWMKYIFNHYRSYNVQNDIGNERALLFSQAKKAALTIMHIVRNEDLVVMTKEEYEELTLERDVFKYQNDYKNMKEEDEKKLATLISALAKRDKQVEQEIISGMRKPTIKKPSKKHGSNFVMG